MSVYDIKNRIVILLENERQIQPAFNTPTTISREKYHLFFFDYRRVNVYFEYKKQAVSKRKLMCSTFDILYVSTDGLLNTCKYLCVNFMLNNGILVESRDTRAKKGKSAYLA